jgi:hypothetical protein
MIKGFITTKYKGLDAVCMPCMTMMIMAMVVTTITMVMVLLLQEMRVNVQFGIQIKALEV